MKKSILIMALLVICGTFAGCSRRNAAIVVGAKDFTEQYILGYMLKLLIEDNTSLNVTYKSDLASDVLFAATRTGAVDLYVEYTGTVYGSYLKISDERSADEVYEISARELMERHNLLMLDRLGFNNTFALAVRADTAKEYNLKTISDLAEVSADFIFGGHAEILNRYDGIPNLKITYNMTFKEERVVDPVLRYDAIANDEIQVIEVFSTDGMLNESNLVVLEDDKQFFPPYQGMVIIRDETAEKHPELLEILGKLAGLLTDEVMQELNYMVNVAGEPPKDVAEDFLRASNLIK
ncbi:MAG: glycine/betaine ABC transporter substrate-binding protein [Oscillospiraceae bacterium]|nr:glycine/betaine ABC transporter substrate-binding protein [Oscillospiraceae bacterium]